MFFTLLALASAKTAVQPRPQYVGDSTQKCIMCKFYVSMIDDWLKEGGTVEEITKKVESLCSYLSEKYQKFCDTLVETGVPIIIEYLEQQMESNAICIALKMCKD